MTSCLMKFVLMYITYRMFLKITLRLKDFLKKYFIYKNNVRTFEDKKEIVNPFRIMYNFNSPNILELKKDDITKNNLPLGNFEL